MFFLTLCRYEAILETCSIFSLNSAEAGLWRWAGAQVWDKGLGVFGTGRCFALLAFLSSAFLQDCGPLCY